MRSFVCSYSGNPLEAAAAQDSAIALYKRPSSQGLAQVRLHQAMSMTISGDPTQGVRHVVGVLEPSFRRGHIGTSASHALQLLPERVAALPEVRQARELMSPGGSA